MDSISIHWEKTNYKSVKDYEDCFFYAFTRGKNILYVGKADRMTVNREIKNHLRKFSTNGISIWLGYIHYSTLERITAILISDIESITICANKPAYPIQHNRKYFYCRNNLKVVNHNLPLLKKTLVVKNNELCTYP